MESELLNCSIIDSVSVSVSVIPFPDSGFRIPCFSANDRKAKNEGALDQFKFTRTFEQEFIYFAPKSTLF